MRQLVFATALFLYMPAASAGTCALCREALKSGGSPGLIQGFYWSIILIAGVPLIVMALASRFIWRLWRASQPPQSNSY